MVPRHSTRCRSVFSSRSRTRSDFPCLISAAKDRCTVTSPAAAKEYCGSFESYFRDGRVRGGDSGGDSGDGGAG